MLGLILSSYLSCLGTQHRITSGPGLPLLLEGEIEENA